MTAHAVLSPRLVAWADEIADREPLGGAAYITRHAAYRQGIAMGLFWAQVREADNGLAARERAAADRPTEA